MVIDKILNYFEDFKQEWTFGINIVSLVLTFLVFWGVHQVKLKVGLGLPEIINLPNFIGNVDSVILALIGGAIFGIALTKTTKLSSSKIFRLSVLIGTLVGFVQNYLIETQFGMGLINQPNVSDPLDVLWGTIFCLIACFVSFKVEERK